MGYQKHSKLNQLHRLLPEGLVADSAWFTRMGYPSSLRSRYLVSGWLQPATLAIPDEVTGLLLRRNQARAEKNWAIADEIRLKIKEMGFEIIDSSTGSRIQKE